MTTKLITQRDERLRGKPQWVIRPQAFGSRCPTDFYFNVYVARTVGLIYSGRFTPAYADGLLSRLAAWIELWRCDPQFKASAEASASNARAFLTLD